MGGQPAPKDRAECPSIFRTSGVGGGWNGKEERVGEQERERREQPEGEVTVLPEREAMWLISSSGRDSDAAPEPDVKESGDSESS
jgi:hypothetical protein